MIETEASLKLTSFRLKGLNIVAEILLLQSLDFLSHRFISLSPRHHLPRSSHTGSRHSAQTTQAQQPSSLLLWEQIFYAYLCSLKSTRVEHHLKFSEHFRNMQCFLSMLQPLENITLLFLIFRHLNEHFFNKKVENFTIKPALKVSKARPNIRFPVRERTLQINSI